MTAAMLNETLLLGALTGMRSLAGPSVLAARHGGTAARIATLAAAGEMVMDKTAIVGNRTDAVPLAGRAMMGALTGGLIARERRGSMLAGGLVGALAAVVMAHLAFQARTRLPLANIAAGLLEDAVVVGLGAAAAGRAIR